MIRRGHDNEITPEFVAETAGKLNPLFAHIGHGLNLTSNPRKVKRPPGTDEIAPTSGELSDPARAAAEVAVPE
jgi:hypothetical protein